MLTVIATALTDKPRHSRCRLTNELNAAVYNGVPTKPIMGDSSVITWYPSWPLHAIQGDKRLRCSRPRTLHHALKMRGDTIKKRQHMSRSFVLIDMLCI